MKLLYRKQGKVFLYTLLGMLLVIVDQVSKFFIVSSQTSLPYMLNAYCSIVYVENTGIVWGLSPEYGLCLSSVGIIVLSIILYAEKNTLQRYIGTLVLSGGISNILDRVYHGAVIDWIDLHINGLHWPSFNCADIYIVTGAGLFLLSHYGYRSRIQN